MQRTPEAAGTLKLVFRLEMQRFFTEPRHLMIVPLVLAGIPIALWEQVASPFLPAAVAGIILAERWIMDMFDQRGREFAKLTVYPLAWRWIILGKGVTAIAIALAGAATAGLTYCWLHPSPPSAGDALRGLVGYMCILIPLVHAGGSASVTELRRPIRTPIDIAVRAVMGLVAALFSSIPVLILLAVPDSLLPLLLYLGLLGVLWYVFGIRRTAEKIRQWQTSTSYNA